MHLIVDHARQQVQPARINRAIDGELRCRINVGDLLILDQYTDLRQLVGKHDRRILDQRLHARPI